MVSEIARQIRHLVTGASVFALERRPAPDEESPGARSTWAVSRRPIGGGTAKDLIASEGAMLQFAPFGDGIVAIQEPPLPAPKDDQDSSDRWDDILDAFHHGALFRAGDGGAPVRVSPEGRRCIHVVGSEGGQWVAYSIAPPREGVPEFKQLFAEEEDESAETHVLGTGPGQEITLAVKGLVRDISPDGARVLVRRAPATPPDSGISARLERIRALRRPGAAALRDHVKALVMVTLKDQTVTDLPATLKVDGADIDTAAFIAAFSGDGLVFRSPQGELYGSALDGSKATRLAGALEGAGAGADGGVPAEDAALAAGTLSTDGGMPADAAVPADAAALVDGGAVVASANADAGMPDGGAPIEKTRRVISPKGTVFELREEASGTVVLSPLGAGQPAADASEAVARFEGPLPALGDVAFDAAEKRVALAVLSDTSRDGSFKKAQDDAAVFVTDDASGSRSFSRAPVTLLAEELKPKIIAAAGLPDSAVRAVAEDGEIKATAELPFIGGEKATALLDRALVAARAIAAAVPQKEVSIELRVESLKIDVIRRKDGDGKRYVVLSAGGMLVADAAALPLRLRHPVRTTLFGSSNETLTGTLENSGSEATGPIEVFAAVTDGEGAARKRREVTKTLGSIAPGKAAKYSLILADVSSYPPPTARFRIAGKRADVFNEYSYDHSTDWLEAVLDVRTTHGVWSEHVDSKGESHRWKTMWSVHLTAEQAALAERAREELFRTIAKRLQRHRQKFHSDDNVGFEFGAPGGGGWRLEEGKKIKRYEQGEEEKPG